MSYRQPFKGEWPITQYYGEKVTSSFHTGIDYGCPIGTPILASSDGVIRFTGYDKTGYGYCVIIEHDSTHSTLYAHMNSLYYSSPGRNVKQGEIIGYSGNTGNSTGPHLHFEARTKWNDYRSHFDPMKLSLMSIDDSIKETEKQDETISYNLIGADKLKQSVFVSAPAGVFAHNETFTSKKVFPYGTPLKFTGKTVEHNGLIFCECLDTVWIAVNDGTTQLLSNQE